MNDKFLLALAIAGVILAPFILLMLAVAVEEWLLRRRADYFKREVPMVDLAPWSRECH